MEYTRRELTLNFKTMKEKDFTNKLLPAQAEMLAVLAEECAEVQQVVMKILRRGYDSYNPFDESKTTNYDLLNKEVGDLVWVIKKLADNCGLNIKAVKESAKSKENRAEKYLHHNSAKLIVDHQL